MPADTSTLDEYTLLCEGCGYVIEGLPTAGACPECGKPIAESLPARQVGSPWQVRPSMSNWLSTLGLVVCRPVVCWDEVRIERESSRSLFATYAWCAAAVAAIFVGLLAMFAAIDADTDDLAAMAVFALMLVLLALPLLVPIVYVLTAIERLGLRLIGARRKWRVTSAVALAVCAHASLAWIVVALLTGLGAVAQWVAADALAASGSSADILNGLPVAGFLAGLAYFETLVYIGVRRCRFANRARPSF